MQEQGIRSGKRRVRLFKLIKAGCARVIRTVYQCAMNPRMLFNWVARSLNPLEKKLLSELGDHLSPEARLLLSRQVEQVNLVQRHAKGKEANLYCLIRGKRSFDENFVFPVNKVEVKLARMRFVSMDVPTVFRVDFWVVRGHIFSLQYDQSPRRLRADRVEIEDVAVLIDPMMRIDDKPRRSIGVDVLTGWLSEWSTKWSLTKLKDPLSKAQRESIVRELDTELPGDYLQLVGQTEGMEIDGCLIHGLSEIRDLVMPEANYYILAEIQGRGVLVVTQESSGADIRFFDYEGGRPINVGSSFRSAVEQQLEILPSG
jgi:hypothetical protein